MDLGLNKIAFCVLGTGLLIIGLQQGSGAFFTEPHHDKPGFKVDVPEGPVVGPTEDPNKPRDYGTLLAAANVETGKELAVRCKQCHSLDPGGPTLQGPPLYGVIGTKVATHAAGFKYSDSLKKIDAVWDFDHLDHFLENPGRYAPGTAMSFPGFKKPADRANVMAYLNTLTPSPIATPAPLPPEATPDPSATPTDGATPAPDASATPGASPSPAASGTPAASPTPAAPKPTAAPAPAPH